jgi:ABC-type multidrug transport system fused ATPase/permease subunit
VLYNGGARLSGGQKSRLALAAALSKKADIYITDDCLRAVDSGTEERILTYLRKLSKRSIVIIVTNRINSLMAADRIVVLSEKGASAEGTHEELLEKSDFYRELIGLQKKEVTACE